MPAGLDPLLAGPVACAALLVLLVLSRPENAAVRLAGAVIVAGLTLGYMHWRITDTLPPPGPGPEPVLAGAFLILDMLVALQGLLALHVLSRSRGRGAEADAHPVESHPGGPIAIDVLIPTYNENRQILRRTIIGAMSQDYPDFRVWVCDDQRRPWVAEMARELGAGYLTRADNRHAKAGNLNAALASLLAGPRPPAAIAVLDADFVATPRFLRRAAALLHDPRTAVVQTPQVFFNPDPIQLNLRATGLMPDEQRFFFDVIMPSKDAHGTAFSCGTSGIIRVAALLEVGGFPTESVTEDMLLSIKLACRGWKTVYLDEPLTAGLAPEGLAEYMNQRGRWCLGAMQIMRTRWSPWSTRPVPLMVRLHTLDSFLFWSLGSLMRLTILFIPPLYWWFGLAVMRVDAQGLLGICLPYLIAAIAYTWWVSRGAIIPVLNEALGLLMLREFLKATWIGLFGQRDQKFSVTAKGATRGGLIIHWQLIGFYLAVGLATLGGILWSTWRGAFGTAEPMLEAITLFWSLYNLVLLTVAGLICIEQPRRRREERFDCAEPSLVLWQDGVLAARFRDLATIGCALRPDPQGAWPAEGQFVTVHVPEVGLVPARVIRRGPDSLHCAFDADRPTEDALTRKLYSGRYLRYVKTTSFGDFVRVALRRAFG